MKTERPSLVPTEPTWRRIAAGGLLFGFVFLTYLPSLSCGFIWDDKDHVVENRAIRSWNGLATIWFDRRATPQYYPLAHTTFWVEYKLWGLNPRGYHLVNVVMHAAVTTMLWRLFVRLEIPGAWVAAAVFGVHPVHVESVTWITERKNVLSGLCYVAALGLVLPLLDAYRVMSTRSSLIGRYLIATLLFAGALLSKSATCSLPAACLLIVYWKRGSITWRECALMFPWLVLGFTAGMQTAWLEHTYVGATGSAFSWTMAERCSIAGHALWFYLGKLLWPHPLVFFNPHWSVDVHRWTGWVAPVSAVLLPVGLWMARNRIGRGPLVAALFFGGTLLPALGLINLYWMRFSFVADHFQYLASLGPIVLIVGSVSSLLSRSPLHVPWASLGWILVLLPLGVTTWHQQAVYRDKESLWSDVLAKNPGSFAAHIYMGRVRTSQGRHAEASNHFRESLRLRPDDSQSCITWTLLGNSLARQGKLAEAKECLNTALRRQPGYRDAIHGLAIIASNQLPPKEAVELFRRLSSIVPDDPAFRLHLGNLLARNGDPNAAITEYETALTLQPDLVEAKFGLANALVAQGRLHEAERLCLEVLQEQPDHTQARAKLDDLRALARAQSKTTH
jgi:protein O-mannosyl-transferase